MNIQRFFACCLGLVLLGFAHAGAAQEKNQRDLHTYLEGGAYQLDIIEKRTDGYWKKLEQVRGFIWEHWRRKRKAHITVMDCATNYEGCSDSSTLNFYIEPGAKGEWQVTKEWDHVHLAFPPFTTEDEHRKGVIIYSQVEQIENVDGLNCNEFLGDSVDHNITTRRLRLTGSSQSAGGGKPDKRCLII